MILFIYYYWRHLFLLGVFSLLIGRDRNLVTREMDLCTGDSSTSWSSPGWHWFDHDFCIDGHDHDYHPDGHDLIMIFEKMHRIMNITKMAIFMTTIAMTTIHESGHDHRARPVRRLSVEAGHLLGLRLEPALGVRAAAPSSLLPGGDGHDDSVLMMML